MNDEPFVLPISGKKVYWRPLKVQESLDQASIYRREENKHLLGPSLLARRIYKIDEKEGIPPQGEWGAWEEFDLEAFEEEVVQKEAARKAAFRKQRATDGTPMGDVKSAIEDAQLAAMSLSMKLKVLLEVTEAAEQAQDPLKSGKT